jgi:hypothetical protein
MSREVFYREIIYFLLQFVSKHLTMNAVNIKTGRKG